MSDTTTPTPEEDPSVDDWASALAEQQTAVAAPATASVGASVFQPLAGAPQTTTRNDIDMILDIPVQLTVELGRTKIAIKSLLQLAQGSVVELDGMAC
jgi:flagellar motor switch protein FliN